MTERLQGSAAPEPGHVFPIRVYWEDTDASGLVYHASYLRFAERARTELLRRLGLAQSALLGEAGIAFVVRRCEIDYLAPARLDDALEIETRVTEMARASLRVEQVIRRSGAVLTRLLLRLACLDRAGRPVRVPAPVRDAFQACSSPL